MKVLARLYPDDAMHHRIAFFYPRHHNIAHLQLASVSLGIRHMLPSNDPNIRYIEKHFNVQRDEDIIDKLRTQVDVYEDSVYHYHKMVEIASYKDSIVRQLIDESNRIKMQINSKKSK